MTKVKSGDEIRYWRNTWLQARCNMPRKSGAKFGSARVLRKLLGYSVGVGSSDTQMFEKSVRQGTKPNTPERANLLVALAGPYGPTIARAAAIQKDIDLSKTPMWP